MLNSSVLMGRLTRDPELKKTQSGISVTSFSIACDRDYRAGDEKKTDFFRVTAWRSTAEFIQKYFSKGQMIGVVGRLQNESYLDKSGNEREITEVIAEKAYFCGSKNAQAHQSSGSSESTQQLPPDYDEDGDLPF